MSDHTPPAEPRAGQDAAADQPQRTAPEPPATTTPEPGPSSPSSPPSAAPPPPAADDDAPSPAPPDRSTSAPERSADAQPAPTSAPASSGVDQKLESEIEQALGDMSIEDMMDMADRPKAAARTGAAGRPIGERERRTGTIVSVHNQDVYVEFGPKSSGVCPLNLFEQPPRPGEQMEFIIDRYDAAEGVLILSRKGKVAKAEWENLEIGQTIEARATGVVKGGLEMEVANHKAFMPASQVDLRFVPDISVFLNEKLPCEVIELDRQRGRIVLSRKKHLEVERGQMREKLLQELQVGQTRPAVITTIKPFGAFADLGGVDGLIHISDLSYERVKDPSEVVKEGDQVEVKVLKIENADADDPREIRIGLGLKQLQKDPFREKLEEISEGQTVSGRVTKLMPFGAFVEIAPGVEGLIHISELSHERVNRVSQVVKPDEVITVKVLNVDPKSKRIGLSIKALKATDSGDVDRREDPHLRKLKAQLSSKFGDNLKGGLG